MGLGSQGELEGRWWGQTGVGPGMAVRREARTLPLPAQLLTFGGGLCRDHGVDAGCQGGEEVPEEEQGVLRGARGSDSEAGGGGRTAGSAQAPSTCGLLT